MCSRSHYGPIAGRVVMTPEGAYMSHTDTNKPSFSHGVAQLPETDRSVEVPPSLRGASIPVVEDYPFNQKVAVERLWGETHVETH